MTSRERVHAAVIFRPVDCVPLDLNLTRAAYERLQRLLGVCTEDRPKPSGAMEVIPHPALLERLGVDCISVKLGGRPQQSGPLPETFRDSWGVDYRLVRQESGEYYEAVGHPLRNASLTDLDAYPWPDAHPGRQVDLLHAQAEDCYRNTDLALVGRFGGPVIETTAQLLGLDEWLVRVLCDRPFAAALLDRIERICTAHDLAGIDAVGPWLSIMKASGEDFGTQRSLLYPPEVFRAVLLPVLRRRWDAVRDRLRAVGSPARVMLHSCGAIRPVIGDLIAAGIEVLDPVQPLAAGMGAAELYAEFGGRVVFHGGIDVQRLLPSGTPDEVRRATEAVLHDFSGLQGGLIAAPSHTVQADTPPENIVAMADAVCGEPATVRSEYTLHAKPAQILTQNLDQFSGGRSPGDSPGRECKKPRDD